MSVLEFYMNRTRQYILYLYVCGYVWPLSLNITVLRFIHIIMCMSRMRPLWCAVFHRINALQLIHSTVDEHLGYVQFLPIVRKAAVNLLTRI